MVMFIYHVSTLTQKAREKSSTTSICGLFDDLAECFNAMLNQVDEGLWDPIKAHLVKNIDDFIDTRRFTYSHVQRNLNVPSDPVIETKICVEVIRKPVTEMAIELELQNEIAA